MYAFLIILQSFIAYYFFFKIMKYALEKQLHLAIAFQKKCPFFLNF